ncbi:MAG: hypothetical protein AAFQ98_19080, partial [Bacteroidota bacterium]
RGWQVRLNQGYGLFGEYHFSTVNQGGFLGAQVGLQQHKISHAEVSGEATFTNLLAMGYFGYTIKPFRNNLYLKPWAGVGYTSRIAGSPQIGDFQYHIAPMTMFATLHIGYTF